MSEEQKEKFQVIISTLRAAAEHVRLAGAALATAACDLAELFLDVERPRGGLPPSDSVEAALQSGADSEVFDG